MSPLCDAWNVLSKGRRVFCWAICCSSHGHIHISSWMSTLYDVCMPFCSLAHFQCHCFLFISTKISVVWLILSPMYSFGLFPSGSLGSQGGSVWDKHSEFPVMSPDPGFMTLSLPLTESWVCQTIISTLKLLAATLFGRLRIPAFCETSRWTYLNFMVGEMYSWNLNFCLDVAHWSLGFYWNLKQIQ